MTNRKVCSLGSPGYRLRGSADGEHFDFLLRVGLNRVGAAAESDIVLTIAGVSRRHATIECDGSKVTVRDLGSKNGTLLNGGRIMEAELRAGDIVCFGPVPLRMEAVGPREVELGIAITPPSGVPENAVRRSGTATPTREEESVPDRWIGVLGRLAELTSAVPAIAPSDLLEVLVSGLKCEGAAVVEVKHSGNVTIRCGAGQCCFSQADEAALIESLGKASERSAQAPRCSLIAGTPPLAVLASRAGDNLALVVTGDFPGREVAGRFLDVALRFVRPTLPALPAPTVAPGLRRPIEELVFPPGHIVGRSVAMKSLYYQLWHLLKGTMPLLITGETGVGKEHVALILHGSSDRARGPFVAVNCAAIPSELLEAELFGIESGVATGVSRRDGKMQLARGGIVFLDEIGDMSPGLQAKLLRALQEREVHPLGARRPVPLDVRILAATNIDLKERMADGRFRSDLYFRIAGYTLHVPSLRVRRDDIPALVEHFMRIVVAETGRPVRGISARALRALVEAPWRGNVRELEHEVRRLVYLCPPGQALTTDMISADVLAPVADLAGSEDVEGDDLNLGRRIEALERRLTSVAMARAGGNQSEAARLLGLSRHGLRNKLDRGREPGEDNG